MNGTTKKAGAAALAALVIGLGALAGCATSPRNEAGAGPGPLAFMGWSTWGGLDAALDGDGYAVTLSGRADSGGAGYVTTRLDTALGGRKVTMEIGNAEASVLSAERLLKITVNREDRIIAPENVEALILDEYVPASYTAVTFTLPEDFDGKLGFVFYQAELRDLRITAYYQ